MARPDRSSASRGRPSPEPRRGRGRGGVRAGAGSGTGSDAAGQSGGLAPNVERTYSVTSTATRSSTVTRVTSTRLGAVDRGRRSARRAVRAVAGRTRLTVRWLGETVTPAGWLLGVTVVLGAAAGLAFGWTLGWIAAAAAAVLLLLCVPFLLAGHEYRARLVLARDRVVAGTAVDADLRVANVGRRLALPGVVDVPIGQGLVEAQVPLLMPGAHHDDRLTISARRRGVIDVGPLSVTRGDPIGILRRTVQWPEVQTLHVHPVTATIPSTSAGIIRDLEGMPTTDIVSADLNFHAIREYLPGDSRRNVHWKSTAKTGRLMVKQYEETRNARMAIVIGVDAHREYAGEDEFELAISVAASLGLQALRDGRDLVVATSADDHGAARGSSVALRQLSTRSPQTLLDGFAEVEGGESASALEDVARLTAQRHDLLSIVFIVTGSQLSVDELRAVAHPFDDSQPVVVRCEENAQPALRRAGRMRVITVGALGDLGQLIARGALA
ncbi:hypothetical protein GCM10027515_08350 [Schumannella luteola]|uniref:Uncharacterized protein (DUF58 family) n=1 Tax=Schumannella luteola TaxID=472059 RepID=A0A852Y531_9MICO|nr:DUF58 domain-containing protein [Schumannella luteola]NYG98036.1 uncharacterized protein (DUF58 family) [Schumannella luteola]TPX01766.1 DUF58 domain-containing protein [Schumannella luteola]